jgi:hypothetical protein
MDSVDEIDDKIRAWMAEQSKRQGYSRVGLAKFAGLEMTVPSKITRGERVIKAGEYVLARRYFGNDPFGDSVERPVERNIKLIETGTFRELHRLDQAIDDPITLGVECPKGLEAYKVNGDGMDNLRPRSILGGDVVFCEPTTAESKYKSGEIVVVLRRAAPQLDLWERILQRISINPVTTTLRFCSNQIKREPISSSSSDFGEDIKIVGIVRGVFTPF